MYTWFDWILLFIKLGEIKGELQQFVTQMIFQSSIANGLRLIQNNY